MGQYRRTGSLLVMDSRVDTADLGPINFGQGPIQQILVLFWSWANTADLGPVWSWVNTADFVFCLFCCFRPQVKSFGHGGTVSSPNHTFSWTSLNKRLTHTFACNWQQPFLNESAEGRKMTVEIISWSISTKVWDLAGIKLATPGSAVRRASVVRHVTDCARRPGQYSRSGSYLVIGQYSRFFLFVLLLYVSSQKLWSWGDGQFT